MAAMDATKVAGCFKDRTILVTGSTGFLAKLVVEKILRVQPDVKKLYLLVRAPDNAAARQRVLHEILGKELFNVLRAKHGADFHSFIQEKISSLAGDVAHQNLGLENTRAQQLFEEIDIIVHGAATTNFYERYDVALASNTFGTAHICQFARQCSHLKLLLHISTAYVVRLQKGQLLEKPLELGQPLKKGRHLDIEAELKLANEFRAKFMKDHSGADSSQKLEKVAMKELGFKRTMDALIVASYEQRLPCFITGSVLDSIPGDMVVNAMMVAMATHYNDVGAQVVYHVTSALQNPLSCNLLGESIYAYCLINPRVRDDKRTIIQHKRPILFSRYAYFYTYVVLAYKTRLQVLYAVNYLLLRGRLTEYHSKLNRSLNYLMSTAKFYAPYIFFKGCFDDTNLRTLWGTTGARHGDGYIFNFDSSCVDWRLYLFNTHIPAVLKVAADMKKQGRA
ncbi:hypothetical protein SORBI_3004G060700 [Sorghum bicolor]|uniref:Fatty acyl-CoA reductase n=1 Tax=Sorghum bicolor TaxID=4558 RepID=A0A1Z5RL56_SORBI|nr:hypothetical protein SORBI_3004G060700 [Sorghum bicolor]